MQLEEIQNVENVEEHNLEFVEELTIAIYNNLDQYGNTVALEFNIDELIAELPARGTCRGGTRNSLTYKDILKMYL